VYSRSIAQVKALGKIASMPSVSIILPVYNRIGFLQLAVESVFAQTYTDWELVIADDGSSDVTRTYLQTLIRPNVRVLWLQHSGNPSRVRNAAIQAASGKYIAFLDSDDTWPVSKLEEQMAVLCAHPERRWSYTMCDHIDKNGRVLDNSHLAHIDFAEGWVFEPLLKLQFSIAMPTVVAERDLVHEIGGFDEAQLFGEFQDICLRLALKSEVIALRRSLCMVRNHDEHYSADRAGGQAGWMRLYQKMIAFAPNTVLRNYCARMRSDASLRLARVYGDQGRYRAVWRTLAHAGSFSWKYPKWWSGAFRCLLRPAVPRFFASWVRQGRP
jgi:glycosyltransferase involved in cell wall biosynthesis